MEDGSRINLLRHPQSWPLIISTTVHVMVIFGLALYILPHSETGGLVLQFSSGDVDDQPLATLQIEADVEEPIVNHHLPQPVELSIDPRPRESLTLANLVGPSKQRQDVVSQAKPSTDVVSVASGDIEQAVDRVTNAIRGQLVLGDSLVVWMIDASESLVDDRPRVAERLVSFVQQVNQEHSQGKLHALTNAIVSFGSKMIEHVAPTQFNEQIASSVENLPIDRTGKEYVFAAVKKCAEDYRELAGNKQLVLAIWTDESGDDIQELEKAIASCTKNRAIAHVIGPSSVLGGQTGYHAFTDPKTNEYYQLPVLRGPDSPDIERLQLGYWYFTRPPSRDGSGRRFILPTWFGNAELEGMLSSFSPYALTRLTLLTHGSYTILDSASDQGPFDLKLMQSYAPEYVSRAEYDQQFKVYPLRAAVHQAVKILDGKQVDEPLRLFFIRRTGERQFDFDNLLYPSGQFVSRYRTATKESLRQAARAKATVDKALALISRNGEIDDGYESEYREESSPRWRAWYDLTRGRLLAFHVRLEEYRLAVEASLKLNGLDPATNHVVFDASPNLRSDSDFQQRGEEATRLLQRCIDQNPQTPWAYMAAREMAYALGVEAVQSVLTPSKFTPANPAPNLPKF